jgi:flagellar biosynthesis chaperone FliJ
MPARDAYPLAALLRVREWEVQQARVEERTARAVVAQRADEASALEQAVGALEARLRSAAAPGARLHPEWQSLIGAWLGQERDAFAAKRAELGAARGVHEQASAALEQAEQRLRALERHRERRVQQQRRDAQRRTQNLQDELWLTRHGRPH